MNYTTEIKSRLPAREVLEFYGLTVDRAGFCKCPFHQGDNTGSLKVYDGDRGWHCFGCGAGTSVVDFVMQYFGLSFIEAQRKINDDFQLGIQMDRKLTPAEAVDAARKVREQKERTRQREDRIRALREAVDRALSAYVLIDRWLFHHKAMLTRCPPSLREKMNKWTIRVLAQRDAAWYNYQQAEFTLDNFVKNH